MAVLVPPSMSSALMGAVVPMPTLPPVSVIAEFWMLHAVVNLATELVVAVPSLVTLVQATAGCGVDAAFLAVVCALELGSAVEAVEELGAAAEPPAELPAPVSVSVVTKAEAGLPPRVSASFAFK